ncbi:MAG: hypothetical protein V4689_07075 [Verrucomicrobiota bacterium]
MDRFRLAVQRFRRGFGGIATGRSLDDTIRANANRLRKSGAPFGLPISHINRAGMSMPLFDLAPDAIESLLSDWVKTEGRTWHSLDDFLGIGDWSSILRSPWQRSILKEARQLHKAQLVYQTIPAYEHLCTLAESGKPVSRQQVILTNRIQINAYFERFVALFRSIEREGFWRVPSPGDRQLGVAITAEGRFARLQGGQHRWAIIMTLGKPTIPVELRMLHIDAWEAAGSVDACIAKAMELRRIVEPSPPE